MRGKQWSHGKIRCTYAGSMGMGLVCVMAVVLSTSLFNRVQFSHSVTAYLPMSLSLVVIGEGGVKMWVGPCQLYCWYYDNSGVVLRISCGLRVRRLKASLQ